jgi:hypothetical protein
MNRLLPLGLALLAGSHTVLWAQTPTSPPATSEQRLSEAESEIQALWQSYFGVVRDGLPNTKGSVDCGTGRYEEIKPTNSYLVFFVACERIEPHLDGYRATIAIGNPHTFGFSSANGTLSYGENIAAALVKESQRVLFATADDLRPGTWTRVQVAIAAASARDVTKIVIEFEAGGAIGRDRITPIRPTSAPQYGMLHRP